MAAPQDAAAVGPGRAPLLRGQAARLPGGDVGDEGDHGVAEVAVGMPELTGRSCIGRATEAHATRQQGCVKEQDLDHRPTKGQQPRAADWRALDLPGGASGTTLP